MLITISPELALRVKLESARLGFSPNEYAAQVIDRYLFKAECERREKAITLLQSWIDEGDEEQKEVGDYLMQMLGDSPIKPSPTPFEPLQSCAQ